MPRIPDRNLAKGVFDSFSSSPLKTNIPKTKKDRFKLLLEEERFDEFQVDDWIAYFIYKAKVGKYITQPNDRKIIQMLMREFSPLEIKTMIDYVFDSNQTLVSKVGATFRVLSGGWTNTMYQNSQKWIEEGDELPKKRKTARNREYIPDDVEDQNERKVRL
jgi:hypothetical protein